MNDLTFYHAVREEMQTGDILYWRSKSFVGSAIRWRTGGKGNHISQIIRLSDCEWTDGRRFHTEAMERGVYPNLLSKRLEDYAGTVWWLPLKPEWDAQRAIIAVRMAEMWGTPYDYKSLFWQLIGKASTDAKQLFCSEFAWKALGFDGIAPNPKELAEDKPFYRGMIPILETE